MLQVESIAAGSIMEPQTEPAEKHWLHGGATNETSIVSWLHGEATNGATNEARDGAKAAIFKLHQKLVLDAAMEHFLMNDSSLLVENLNFRLNFY